MMHISLFDKVMTVVVILIMISIPFGIGYSFYKYTRRQHGKH